MQNTMIATLPSNPLAAVNKLMAQAGKAANKAAARHVFDNALSGKAKNTDRRKKADLALFETFLNECGVPARELYSNPQAWQGVTWGIVESFKAWMLKQGYAMASVNGRLSTVRSHAALAMKAGAISEIESRMIASVKGYTQKEARHVDEKRRADGLNTRKGSKKAQTVNIPEDISQAMISQPNTPQGRRDSFLMCLLLEHGLRVSEVAILTRDNFDLKNNKIIFYRPKVNKTQTHTLSANTRKAAAAYLKHDCPADGILWRRSHKGTNKLGDQLKDKSATRALTKRVELLGRKAGISGLSAHDARHYCATFEANNDTPIKRMMDMFGWNSPAMATRYIASAEIANAGTARIKNDV